MRSRFQRLSACGQDFGAASVHHGGVKRPLLVPLVATAIVGCASIRPRAPQAAAACTVDSSLVGEWTDRRMTQLGPAWMKLSLHGDCRSTIRAQLLWMRIARHAPYRVTDGAILFQQVAGETRWPFRVAGDRLYVEEFAGEHHAYRRAQ